MAEGSSRPRSPHGRRRWPAAAPAAAAAVAALALLVASSMLAAAAAVVPAPVAGIEWVAPVGGVNYVIYVAVFVPNSNLGLFAVPSAGGKSAWATAEWDAPTHPTVPFPSLDTILLAPLGGGVIAGGCRDINPTRFPVSSVVAHRALALTA
jgi:hypothetical protein